MRTPFRVGAIVFHDGKVVTTKLQKKGQEYHVLPGGGVESEENINQALIRELKEELNIQVKKFRLVYIKELNLTLPEFTGRGMEFYFVVDEYEGTPTLGYDPEIKEAKMTELGFLQVNEIKNYKFFPIELIPYIQGDALAGFKEFRHLGLHNYP